MNGIQKVIKIFAICLAVFIIVNICGWIIFGINLLVRIGDSGSTETWEEGTELEYYEGSLSQNITEIDIDIKSTKLTIKAEGTEFALQINDRSDYHIKEENGKLKIKENSAWFWNNERPENIIITIPESAILNDLDIDSGGGKIRIDGVKSNKINIDQGAGLLEVENCNFDKINIDGGAGEIKVLSSVLNDLKLNAGVGRVGIDGEITGNSKIECGIGEIDVNLIGGEESYKITAEKGIGSIKINNEEQGNNTSYGRRK